MPEGPMGRAFRYFSFGACAYVVCSLFGMIAARTLTGSLESFVNALAYSTTRGMDEGPTHPGTFKMLPMLSVLTRPLN